MIGNSQIESLGWALPRPHGTLILGRETGHGQYNLSGVDNHNARVESVARGTCHGGQSGPGLYGLGDLLEGREERAGGTRLGALLGG